MGLRDRDLAIGFLLESNNFYRAHTQVGWVNNKPPAGARALDKPLCDCLCPFDWH
ncbi:hypothetical protein D3C76_1482860 [compost metagenome]